MTIVVNHNIYNVSSTDIRQRLTVHFINAQGLNEAGEDGGGLFIEFLLETLMTAFHPNTRFFELTEEGLLYPNPKVHLFYEDYQNHFRFLGALLGKVISYNTCNYLYTCTCIT